MNAGASLESTNLVPGTPRPVKPVGPTDLTVTLLCYLCHPLTQAWYVYSVFEYNNVVVRRVFKTMSQDI